LFLSLLLTICSRDPHFPPLFDLKQIKKKSFLTKSRDQITKPRTYWSDSFLIRRGTGNPAKNPENLRRVRSLETVRENELRSWSVSPKSWVDTWSTKCWRPLPRTIAFVSARVPEVGVLLRVGIPTYLKTKIKN
jgi:hypothetical protein